MKRRFRVQRGEELTLLQKTELVKGALLTHVMLQIQEPKTAPVKHIAVPNSWRGVYKEDHVWNVFRAVAKELEIQFHESDVRRIGLVYSDVKEPIAVADSPTSTHLDFFANRDGVW